MKKPNLTKKDYKRRLKINYFKLLYDDLFWIKYVNTEPSQSFIKSLKFSKIKLQIPRKEALLRFIENYRYISGDTRSDNEIILWLLSEAED